MAQSLSETSLGTLYDFTPKKPGKCLQASKLKEIKRLLEGSP